MKFAQIPKQRPWKISVNAIEADEETNIAPSMINPMVGLSRFGSALIKSVNHSPPGTMLGQIASISQIRIDRRVFAQTSVLVLAHFMEGAENWNTPGSSQESTDGIKRAGWQYGPQALSICMVSP
jgi:hypothetical protein